MAPHALEIKAYVPAVDLDAAQRFYRALGFGVVWSTADLAYLRHGRCAFLLQRFADDHFISNYQMHLLVDDVDAWWQAVLEAGVLQWPGVRAEPPAERPWGLRDFVLFDPSGVLWRIAERPAVQEGAVE